MSREISWARVGRPSDVLKIGDKVKVKVKEIDNLGRVNLTMKELMPKPEGYVETQARSQSGFPSDRRGFNGGDYASRSQDGIVDGMN